LILSSHPHDDCLACIRSTKCELQSLAEIYSTGKSPFQKNFSSQSPKSLKEISCNTLVRDMDKCVKCGRCVEACQELQTVRAINTSHRSANYGISTPYNQTLSESPCVFCGQCAEVCPVGAIYEHDQSAEVWALIKKKKQDMVIEIAPSEAQAVCAELGLPTEAITIGKIITGIKRMGFSSVYNAESFTAMSANEETGELIERIKSSSRLPMISCCLQACTKFVKEFYPDLANHLSKAKSPEQNFRDFIGGAKKTFVSIVPCIAKKYKTSGGKNSRGEEIALSVGELAKLIRLSGIDPSAVQESAFDSITGEARGIETKTKIQSIEVNGLANARKVLDSIRSGGCDATFVKIFSCPSGCKTGAK
jgi:iron only hydrogenase large subunit-like protein